MKRYILNILAKFRRLLYIESFSVLIVAFAFIALFFSAFLFLVFGDWQFSLTMNEEKIGQFGDFVGGFIGTILAFAASLLYLLALKEQRKDVRINQISLQKQTEEFENQVSELKQSRRTYEEQLKMMQMQQFDSNFYSYFNIYLEIKTAITEKKFDGKSLLNDFLSQISNNLQTNQLSKKNEYEAYKIASQEYCKAVMSNNFVLSHYFRTFYRLVTLALSAPIGNDVSKMKYVKIIRSQLTEEELLVLYYNSHSRYAGQSKQLLYEYNILKHLSPLHKYEIRNRFTKYGVSNLMTIERFYDFFSPKIIDFINIVCDNIDEQSKEYMYDPLNIVLKLEYTDDVCISLIDCRNNQDFNNLKTCFRYLLFDLLFNSQMRGSNGTINSVDNYYPHTDFKQIQYKIDNSLIGKIIIDKDDE